MSDLDEASFDNNSELSEVEHLSGGGDEAQSGDYDDDLDLSYDDIEETKEELKKQGVIGVESQLAGLDIGSDGDDEEEDEEDEEDEGYLKKFDKELRKNYLVDLHPESVSYNNIEIQTLSEVVRDPKTGIIIDEFHKTIPFLTKYEKTRILGVRAKQIDNGAKPFIDTAKGNLIDGYVIAQKEMEVKRVPFIIRRPLPNGGSEFWKLSDLQIIN